MNTQAQPTNKEVIRQFVTGIYDIQKLRVSMGNRICQQFRHKLGLKESEKEESDENAAKVLDAIRVDFRRITDGLVKHQKLLEKDFKGQGVISDYAEYLLIATYMDLLARETAWFRDLESQLVKFPIYTDYLSAIDGIGPAMAGVLIVALDPHKARHASCFWKYAGLDVAPAYNRDTDGNIKPWPDGGSEQRMIGRSRRRDHLVPRAYVDSEGNEQTRMSVTYNPWLKTKLFVLATCLIRSGNERYVTIYRDYKHRLENRPDWKDRSKGHRHAAAMRYMVKIFLSDLWKVWRAQEGLEVGLSYAEAKLGLPPHGTGGL